ncbi:MAG: hypothetical protein HS102_11795 [Planctomycetia bacterium]|nr:hypothetical protein [Planctomycetia bacterium]
MFYCKNGLDFTLDQGLGRLRSAAPGRKVPQARHRFAPFFTLSLVGMVVIASARMPFPDDPCLSPPAICDPRIAFLHPDGVLFVTGAPSLPGSTDPAGFIGVWRDYAEAKPYVFGRRIFTHTDVGHCLLRLETLFSVDRNEFTTASAILNDSVNWALVAPPDTTSWLLATRGQIATMLGFDVSDITDPNDLLADDDKDGDLDTDDECGDVIGGGGVPVNFEFAPTSEITLDDLTRELGLGIDCCDADDCCDNDGDCSANEHCVDGECFPDECHGDEDCPEGQHCENGECVHDPCSDPGECAPGQECVDGECKDDCDDEGDCDAGDTCDDGYCEDCPGECCDAGDCDDGNDCTMDYCRNGKCKHPAKNCNDENPCTNDFCDFGTCHHPDKCYDGNPCTEDDCDMQTGQCSYTCLDCEECPDEGLCDGCTCVTPSCDLEFSVEPELACSGDVVEVTLTTRCNPDCGSGS